MDYRLYKSKYKGSEIDSAIDEIKNKGTANTVAPLDNTGKVPSSNLPDVTVDIPIEKISLNGTEVPPVNKEVKLTVNATTVGLDKVNNTSDAEKPISNATAAALEGKFDKTGGNITGDVDISGILEVSGNINAKAGISAVNDITVAGAPVATKNNAGLTVGNLVKWGTGYVLDDSGKSIDDLLSKIEADESYVPHSTDQEGKFVLYSRTGTNVDGVTVLGTTEALSESTNIPVYVASNYGASLVNGYLMTNIPSQDYQAANKKYVDDGFVAKYTETHTGLLAYTATPNNTTRMLPIANKPSNSEPGHLAVFGAAGSGTTEVPGVLYTGTPQADYEAANKKYVDDNTGIYIDTSLLAEA